MVINFDGIIYSSRNSRGGISVFFNQLITRSSIDFDVNVVIPYNQFSSDSFLPSHICNYTTKRFLERFRSPPKLQPGLLHTSYYRISKSDTIKNIVSVYDFSYEFHVSGPRKYIHSAQKAYAFKHASALVCISENTRSDLVSLYPKISPDMLHVIPLAANPIFQYLPNKQTPIQSPFVLFVGNRIDYKNFNLAVRSISLLADVHLYCVGGGNFTKKETSFLEHFLPSRYRGFGYISESRLNLLYNHALCLLYPSSYEGFGIPPLEAISCGCPVVAFKSSSIPEVLGQSGLYIEEPTPECVSSIIDRCCYGQLRESYVSSGLNRAKLFSWEKSYQRMKDLYLSFTP